MELITKSSTEVCDVTEAYVMLDVTVVGKLHAPTGLVRVCNVLPYKGKYSTGVIVAVVAITVIVAIVGMYT